MYSSAVMLPIQLRWRKAVKVIYLDTVPKEFTMEWLRWIDFWHFKVFHSTFFLTTVLISLGSQGK